MALSRRSTRSAAIKARPDRSDPIFGAESIVRSRPCLLSSDHLASLEPRQPAFEIGEFDGVDHRQHAARHPGEAVENVAHRGADEPKVRYRRWTNWIRLRGHGRC